MAVDATTIQKTEIQSELSGRQRSLETQIDHIDNLVRDLISHKISLETANRQIEQLAMAEQDANKRAKFYTSLRMNIELLTKIFDSISKLEGIKHQYHKEIDVVLVDKIKLISIEIRKLDEKTPGGTGEDLVVFFEKLGNLMMNIKASGNTKQISVDADPEYKL